MLPFWVLALSALTTGTIEVLLPLRFDVLGLSASLIGVLFFVSASLEAIASPFAGRLSDRVGRYPVISGGMILGALVSLALVVNDELATAVVAVTAVAFVLSAQSAPAAALLSDSVERVGLGQERAAELLNVA